MGKKFEKPVKWEHFDRFLRITLFTCIKSILKHFTLASCSSKFLLSRTYLLDILKIIWTPPNLNSAVKPPNLMILLALW